MLLLLHVSLSSFAELVKTTKRCISLSGLTTRLVLHYIQHLTEKKWKIHRWYQIESFVTWLGYNCHHDLCVLVGEKMRKTLREYVKKSPNGDGDIDGGKGKRVWKVVVLAVYKTVKTENENTSKCVCVWERERERRKMVKKWKGKKMWSKFLKRYWLFLSLLFFPFLKTKQWNDMVVVVEEYP